MVEVHGARDAEPPIVSSRLACTERCTIEPYATSFEQRCSTDQPFPIRERHSARAIAQLREEDFDRECKLSAEGLLA